MSPAYDFQARLAVIKNPKFAVGISILAVVVTDIKLFPILAATLLVSTANIIHHSIHTSLYITFTTETDVLTNTIDRDKKNSKGLLIAI